MGFLSGLLLFLVLTHTSPWTSTSSLPNPDSDELALYGKCTKGLGVFRRPRPCLETSGLTLT